MNLLIIEDDYFLSQIVYKLFIKKGSVQNIKTVPSYKAFFDIFPIIKTFDIIITDLSFPEGDGVGFDVIRSIRCISNDIPIIVMSSYSDIEKLHQAFKLGASDYFIKPLRLKELEVRIDNWFYNSTMTRFFRKDTTELNYYELRYHIEQSIFTYNGELISLSKNSKYLLSYLLLFKESVVYSSQIKERLWGDIDFSKERNLRIAILRLKKSLEGVGIQDWIHTIHGEGYMLKSTGAYSLCCR